MQFLIKLTVLLIVVKAVCAVQCIYFPREFISYSTISNDTIAENECKSMNPNSTALWNEFVKSQVNFLTLQQCLIFDGTELKTTSNDCIAKIVTTFQPLFNNPLCREAVGRDSSMACIFDSLDPCLTGERAGPKGNILSLLCKLKLQGQEWLKGLKGSLKLMGLDVKYLHYYTAGRYSDVHSLRNSDSNRLNQDTVDFIGDLMCSKTPDGNCCSEPSGCNLPKNLNQTSFFAQIGAKEMMDAYATDGYLQQYLTSLSGFYGVQHPASENDGAALGMASHRRADNESWPNSSAIVAATVGAMAFACLALLACLLGICYSHRRRLKLQQSQRLDHQQQQKMLAVPNNRSRSSAGGGSSSTGVCNGDSLPSTQQQQQQPNQNTSGVDTAPVFDHSQTGSGSGLPILLPRTVAREIEHRELIGQGRFGQVYRSEWRNDPVAVKIFSSRAESSWSTEGHMYELPGMRHDSILGFIAIDNIDIGLETQLWLITDYHANGSLQSYLTRCTVDQHTMARMLHSIASGLAHLHSEITGVKCKPAIAHRDIKSNNILVKSDLSCCIADFGLAVALQPGCGNVIGFGSGGLGVVGGSDSGIGEANNGLVGTRRYLSPECLNASQDARDFTALRKADVYATGLVFWELAVRGITAEPEYQQPYHDLVPNNPTLEEMQAVVCPPANARPPILPIWHEHPVLSRLCQVLTECWYQSPAARLEAMSVKDQTARMLHSANELLAADKETGTVVA
uniref:receptor protein serine/threonine kinase n=1 Tax=Macrostomum lignano TaxID=282301 RepID=A0A1I8J7A1_9PLAT